MKSCGQIHELLEDFLSGKLDSKLNEEVQAHLLACPDCTDLASILSGDMEAVDVPAPPRLAASVLESTTGRACSQAEEILPDFVDGELTELDGELISLHLEGCDDCRSLARALRRMSRDLTILAEAEPGPRFAARVIEATSERVRRDKQINVWRRLVQRPRFAFEVAYAAMVALVLILGVNGTGEIGKAAAGFMRTASGRAASAQGEVVEEAAQSTALLSGAIAKSVASGARDGVTTGRALVKGPAESIKERADGVSKWLKGRWNGLADRLETQKNQSDKNKEVER